MLPVLVLLMALVQEPDSTARDSLRTDSIRTDTLREVTVKGNTRLPVNEAIAKSLGQHPIIKGPPTLGDLLGPKINDYITHPFAIKDRKREKLKKKHRKILEHYDQVKTFEDLLKETYWQLHIEDSLKMAKDK